MEISSSILLAVLAILLGLLWIRQHIQARKFPPGPWGLPIVGYLPFLGEYAYETLFQLGEKYGSIFSVVLGNEKVVVLNDWAAVKAALVDQYQLFSGRPPMFVFDNAVKGRDVTTSSGPVWKAHRSLAIQTLKLVIPEKSDRESLFMGSINSLIEKYEKQDGQKVTMGENFFVPVLNIIWKIACNKTIEDGDDEGKMLHEILRQNFRGFRNNSPVNFMPYMRYLVPGGFGYWTYMKYHDILWSYLEREIEEHIQTFKEGECRDYLDAFIAAIRKHEQQNQTSEPPYTTQNLAGSFYDLFLAGVETNSNTLGWSIMALSVWPQFQDKIQEELDDVIGRGRVPVLADIPMLPYLEAFTLEIHRYTSLVPLSIFHTSSKDTEVLGHPVPKGCTVIQNIYGVHRDPKCWENPFEFRPERFLDSQNRVIRPPYVIPFSVGARKCLGASLAKQTIFLFLACILQRLKFRLPPNEPQPSWQPIVGLTLTPQNFSVIVTKR